MKWHTHTQIRRRERAFELSWRQRRQVSQTLPLPHKAQIEAHKKKTCCHSLEACFALHIIIILPLNDTILHCTNAQTGRSDTHKKTTTTTTRAAREKNECENVVPTSYGAFEPSTPTAHQVEWRWRQKKERTRKTKHANGKKTETIETKLWNTPKQMGKRMSTRAAVIPRWCKF